VSDKKAVMHQPSDHEMVVTRTINAPRELVFAAWSDPKHLAHWFGPDGFTLTTHSMEFAVGGFWRFIMHGPDGTDFNNAITYLEIDAPQRIVYKHAGEAGTEPVRFRNEVTFEALGENMTRFTMHSIFDSAAALRFVIEHYQADKGGVQTTDRLAAYVGSLQA
jgi:uncharacterized protein YndB with AHSA1/START domain